MTFISIHQYFNMFVFQDPSPGCQLQTMKKVVQGKIIENTSIFQLQSP